MSRPRIRRRLVVLSAIALVVAVAFGLVPLPSHDDATRAAARAGRAPATRPVAARVAGRRLPAVAPLDATASVASSRSALTVPQSYLGVSTEYWALPLFYRHVALFERALALIHAQGNGPLSVRIGGDSADHTFWDPMARNMPHWVFKLTPAWLNPTAQLVRRLGVRLILDLNLVTGSPIRAAEWAQAAEREMPHGSIAAFEIGNEPDIYSRWFWLATVSRTTLGATLLPTGLTADSYAQVFRAYATALAQVAPHVPLIGPAVANPALDVNWISGLIDSSHPGLGTVSAHRYPLSACATRASQAYPTIARVLGEPASAGIAHTLAPAIALAHRADLPFRLTELNSVTCGGRPGVSDTFATALWAPDALFELLGAGVDGINVHVRANTINAAFALSRNGFVARPLLYGLILFTRTLGPGAQLVPVSVHAPSAAHLKVWAVRVRGGTLHVLLINKGNRSVRVQLALPATGPARVQRLLAASAASRWGVTLNGQRLGHDGAWHGRAATESIAPGQHGYSLMVPRVSAALIDVAIRPTTARPPATPAKAHRR